jgi:hypothetical protein
VVIRLSPFSGASFSQQNAYARRDSLFQFFGEKSGLEVGVFKLPRPEGAARAVELRASELAMILDGIDVSRLERVQRYERPVG